MPEASSDLFCFLNIPPVNRRGGLAAVRWLVGKKQHFSFFVFLSLVAHLALFGMVILLGPEGKAPPSPAASRARDFLAFREALQEYAADGPAPERLANALMALSEEEIREAFFKAPVLDYRLNEREKAGLYKMMVAKAMADFREGTGEERSALDLPLSRYFKGIREMPAADPSEDFVLVRIDNALDESARLFRLSKEKAQTLESLRTLAGDSGDRSTEVRLLDEDGRLSTAPGEYFYRDSPYLEIAAAGAQLFYVVRGFPELRSAGPEDGSGPMRGDRNPEAARNGVSPQPPSPAFVVIFMPSGGLHDFVPAPSAARPSLELPEKELDRVLDGLMPLPVEEQVRRFNRDYLKAYDPDSSDLARLTREFIYRNLGMVFVQTGDPLSRGFDLLEEVYYDTISMDAIVPYALKNLRSRTGAEILLCLAASYEFERRAIAALDGSLEAAELVLADPSGERFYVHNKSVKAYVLREVYRDLAAELRSRDFLSLQTVLQKYRDEQLRIYDLLKGMGGDIECRALYALGRFHWDEGRTEQAMETWKDTDPAFADETLTRIRGAIIERRRPLDAVPRIDDILGRQAAAGKSQLLERIARFHKWKER